MEAQAAKAHVLQRRSSSHGNTQLRENLTRSTYNIVTVDEEVNGRRNVAPDLNLGPPWVQTQVGLIIFVVRFL